MIKFKYDNSWLEIWFFKLPDSCWKLSLVISGHYEPPKLWLLNLFVRVSWQHKPVDLKKHVDSTKVRFSHLQFQAKPAKTGTMTQLFRVEIIHSLDLEMAAMAKAWSIARASIETAVCSRHHMAAIASYIQMLYHAIPCYTYICKWILYIDCNIVQIFTLLNAGIGTNPVNNLMMDIGLYGFYLYRQSSNIPTTICAPQFADVDESAAMPHLCAWCSLAFCQMVPTCANMAKTFDWSAFWSFCFHCYWK